MCKALACSKEYHDNDHSLMPTQEAMSDDYASGTPSSEECVCVQLKLGVRMKGMCTIDHDQRQW
jgi:hypothetical protein